MRNREETTRNKHFGFWQELDVMKNEDCMSNASFGFLENVALDIPFEVTHGLMIEHADMFLHGYCDIFANILHKVYGYEMMALFDDGALVHAFCVSDIGGIPVYIDVRGITADAAEFFSEFGDAYSVCTVDDPFVEYMEPQDLSEVSYSTHAVEDFISAYREYYQTGGKETYPLISFRNRGVSYSAGWQDGLYVFDFGDGEFVDSDGDSYFIHVEYNPDKNKWIAEVWWEDDHMEIRNCNPVANMYMTSSEFGLVKAFIVNIMNRNVA